MPRKMIGLAIFIATGMGLIISSIMRSGDITSQILLLVIALFYVVGLSVHYKELNQGGK